MPRSLLMVLMLLTAFSASAKQEARSLLVMNFQANNVDEQTVNTIESLVTTELSRFPSLRVMGGSDVAKMLDLEAQKQASGCDDDSSCLSEIAGALGAQLVVTGQLGRLGGRLILTLNLFDGPKGEPLNRVIVKANNLDHMPEQISAAVSELMSTVTSSAERNALPEADVATRDFGPWPWITMGLGGATCLLGLGCSSVIGLVWAGGITEANELDLVRQRWDKNVDDPKTVGQQRRDYEVTREFWNDTGLPLYWATHTITVLGLGVMGMGIGWELSE